MRHRQTFRIALLLLLIAPAVVRAADILQQVPNDALGFVVVHNLSAVDGKARSLSSDLRNNAFSPLQFLNSIAGIREGLNPSGDFLFVVYGGGGPDKSQFRYGVWLPISDYARFMNSIGGTPGDGVATAKIAGEDLLIAHRGDWVIVMDPDDRARMDALVATGPSPPPKISAWKSWVDTNDITIVALAAGIREFSSWADEAAENGAAGDESSDNLFGSRESAERSTLVAARSNRSSTFGIAAVLNEFHKWTTASPAFAQAVQQANIVGCGFRLGADSAQSRSVQAKLRIAFEDAIEDSPTGAEANLPFSIYDKGGFAITGAGRFPKSVLAGLSSAYLQYFANELRKEEHTEFDDESLKQLTEAVEQAAADVRAVAVLMQPGAPQPVYTNDFLVLRVSSTSEFLNHATEVMRLWNKANRESQGETRLIFEAEEAKIAGRSVTQYSIDMAAVAGEPVLPETRQAMEKLFGPGGKLRIWFAPADTNTVLLARGTADQVAAALKNFDRKQPIDFNRGELSESNRLLSTDAAWRIFFDPHRYNEWVSRESAAMNSVPVIDGPLVKPFRECPPIGIAGSFQDREVSIEMVAMQPTVKAAYDYFTAIKRRPEVQRRLQPAAR